MAEYKYKTTSSICVLFPLSKKDIKKSIRFAISMRMDGYLLQVNVTFCYEGNVMG